MAVFPAWRRSIAKCLRYMMFFIVLVCVLSSHEAPAGPPTDKHILVLYAYGFGGRGVNLFDDGFFQVINDAGFPVSNVYAEHLDLQRNRDLPGYDQEMSDMLHRKYAQRHIDLIVTVQQPALQFLLTYGKDIAPQAPVISVQGRALSEAEKKEGRRIIGKINQFDIKGTLELALKIFPQTRHVVFASGSSVADINLAERAAHIAGSLSDKLEFEDTTGMSLNDMLDHLSHLPPHSVILFTQYNKDTKDHIALAYEVENMIVKKANAPVFGLYDYNLRNGGIGGSVVPVVKLGSQVGTLALDILNDVPLTTEGTLEVVGAIPMIDWQQLQRRGGDVSRLPASTVFINRPLSAWQQYSRVIVGTLVFIIIQSLLIVTLLINIRRRKIAESILVKSEAQLLEAQDIASMGRWELDLVNNHLMWSDGIFSLCEVRREDFAASYEAFFEFIHPDDRDHVDHAYREALKNKVPYEIEHRLLMKDGRIKWVNEICRTEYDTHGQPVRSIGTVQDVTARKQYEKSLASSEKEFRELAEAMPQIVWATRPDGWNIYFNQQWVDYTGMTLEESYGHGWNTPFHPDDQQRAWDAWQKATATAGIYAIDCRLRRADGVYRWWLIRGVPVRDTAGTILKWFGTCTDIEDIKRAEQTLQHKAEELRASNVELELFNRAMVGRELRMIELKKEINELFHRLGEPPRYTITTDSEVKSTDES